MSARKPLDTARYDREMAECAAYDGPDLVGAAMGWADYAVEKELILRELRDKAEVSNNGTFKEN